MQKVKIKNREGKEIAVIVEGEDSTKGLAFVMHGHGGFKEQKHVETFAHAFLEKGFIVVRFDTGNTFGESYGRYEDASVTGSYQDLEDVIDWASKQAWYREPFALAGHSLGSMCISLYAENHPEKVLALAPISTVVSGVLGLETYSSAELKSWEETGWREQTNESKPSFIKRIPWSYALDKNKYDILVNAFRLTMPVLLIVGDHDAPTPIDHQRKFFDVLPGPKEIHIIKGAPHTFRDPVHLEEIKGIFLKWISSWQK
ncbi:MAG: alpha/beta fold hydrolase [bacterium]|nr:alpha/beta fold hydrolase [bacterium]